MGTLMDKLNATNATKEQIRQAIERKKVSVPTNTPLKDYPAKIDGIYPDALFLKTNGKLGVLPKAKTWGHVFYVNGAYVLFSNGINDYEYARGTEDDGWSILKFPVSIQVKINGSCYGNGKVLAVGYNSNKAISTENGTSWTQATLPLTESWKAVTYGNGMFVAVGDTSIIKSYDGVSWSIVNTNRPFSYYYYGIKFCNDRFFIYAGRSQNIFWSKDLLSWTRCLIDYDYSCALPSYINGIYVIPCNTCLCYSVDNCDTWYRHSGAGVAINIGEEDCVSGNGVVVSSSSNYISTQKSGACTMSLIGGETAQNTHLNFSYPYSPTEVDWVSYTNGKFFGVPKESSTQISYSFDGYSWVGTLDTFIINNAGADVTSDIISRLNDMQTATLQAAYQAGVNSI